MLVRAMRRRPNPPTGGVAGEIRRRRGISTDRTLAADTHKPVGVWLDNAGLKKG